MRKPSRLMTEEFCENIVTRLGYGLVAWQPHTHSTIVRSWPSRTTRRSRSSISRSAGPIAEIAEAAAAVALDGVCAAVLDYRLGNDNVATLCEALEGRRIPFVLYSGYCDLQESFPKHVILQKPAHGESLLAAIAGLLSPTPAGRCDAELSVVASLVNGADVTLPLEE